MPIFVQCRQAATTRGWLQYDVGDDDTAEGNDVECAGAPVRVPFS